MGSMYSGSNLQRKGDIRYSSCYGAVRRLRYGMKAVEKVFEKRLNGIVSVD